MTALALTPDLDTASVTLEITGAPAGPVTITRTDANGSGRLVRLLPSQEPISGALTTVDYEPALTGTVVYDVRDTDLDLTSASTTLDGAGEPQLLVAVLPQYRVSLPLVTNYTAARDSSTTLHTIIGRPDPIATMGHLATRTGTLAIWCPDHATARAIELLADRGEVLMFRQADHAGMDLYLTATRTQITPDPAYTPTRRWGLDLTYTEVACPIGPYLGALGWTFAEVAALGTFAALPDLFDTFADLTAGFLP